MAGKPDAKLKLLYLKEIFEKYTDEDHILNSTEIVELLSARYGIECERKSIYKDIEILSDYGMDIIKTRSPRNGFFLASRPFEAAEVRLLTDAVQAADFISKRKTMLLIQKIEGFVSVDQAAKLHRQVYIDNRHKCSNEEIYYSIDALDTAIKTGRKVRLQYTKRKLDAKFAAQEESREFVLSPYALIWSNDHYYLVANNGKYDNLMNVRVDRIHHVEILDEPARHFSEVSEYKTSFDSADYASKVFNMFSGKPETVELKCSVDLIEEIVDRFGETAAVRRSKEGWFLLREEMSINDGLVSWIMQFGDKIEVVRPAALRDMVKEKAEKIAGIYH